jgi:PmbA protein
VRRSWPTRPAKGGAGSGAPVCNPTELAQDVVRRARRAGAEEAEVFYQDQERTTIELREQEVESLGLAATRGLGLRVIVGGASSYVYTPDLRPRALSVLARRAVALAREGTPDPDRILPDLPEHPPTTDLEIFDPDLADVSAEQKIEILRQSEQASRAADGRVRSTEIARYRDSLGTVALANSRGLAASYQRSSASVSLVVIARQDGSALRGYGYSVGRSFDDLSAEVAGRQAARRAVMPLSGQPVPTQSATVVMEPEVAAELLGQLARALSGAAVVKGRSMFVGRLGERVGSDLVTLVDQGNLPGGLGSSPFDGEGVPTARTVLVEGGLLRSFMHTTYTARRSGAASTGNAIRPGYQDGPSAGPTNFALAALTTPRARLLSNVRRGLHVVTTRNVGGISPISGDYSVGAAGVWLENGEEVGPVAGVTIAGNMYSMLDGLVEMADDFRWVPSGGMVGTGTIRIEGMTIAGA